MCFTSLLLLQTLNMRRGFQILWQNAFYRAEGLVSSLRPGWLGCHEVSVGGSGLGAAPVFSWSPWGSWEVG